MKTLKFDLMRPTGGGKEYFVATMCYQWNDLKLDLNKLVEFIYDKRPTLKDKPFNIYPNNDKVVKKLCFNQDIKQIMRDTR